MNDAEAYIESVSEDPLLLRLGSYAVAMTGAVLTVVLAIVKFQAGEQVDLVPYVGMVAWSLVFLMVYYKKLEYQRAIIAIRDGLKEGDQ